MSVGVNASNMFFGSGDVAPDFRSDDDGGGIFFKVASPISTVSIRQTMAVTITIAFTRHLQTRVAHDHNSDDVVEGIESAVAWGYP